MAKEVAVRKRQKILSAHRVMMTVVLLCTVLSSFLLIGSFHLFKLLNFNQKVISEQQVAVDNLRFNKLKFESLRSKINALRANKSLLSSRTGDEIALRVISDALPDRGNSAALGSSLSNRIFDISSVEAKNLTVGTTEEEVNNGSSTQGSQQNYDDVDSNPIYFSVDLIGEAADLEDNLVKLEKSIRPLYVDKIEFKSGVESNQQNGQAKPRYKIIIFGRSFYEPEVKKESLITTKTIRRKDEN